MEKLLNFMEKNRTWGLAIIFVLTILAYSNIFANQFVWDDPDFYQNWTALYSFDSLPRLALGEVPLRHFGVFRPLRGVFQLFIFQILGPTNLIGYHILSLAIHLICVWLFYLLTEKITGQKTIAFLTALFFGLHPIHTEAITYITTSVDEIGIIWLLLAIFFYLNFNPKKPGKKNYVLSLIFALMAFFSYEISLILPALIILIDLFQKNFDYNKLKEKIKYYLPYFIVLGFWVSLKLALAPGNRQLLFGQDVSLPLRLFTMGKAFAKYLFLLVWPQNLNVYHKIIFAQDFNDRKAILAWLFLFALLISAVILAKKIPAASFAGLWFFVCLAPVSNIIPTGIIMAEKYAYLMSFSFCFLLAAILEKLISGQKQLFKYLAIIAVLVIAVFYGAATYARNFDWKNDKTLWEKTLTQRPDYGRVYNNLGFISYQEKNYQKALTYLNQAAKLEPNLPMVYHNLGNTYDELGDYEKAIANFQKAIDLNQASAETYNNLGIVYQKNNGVDQAVASYKKATEIDKNYFRAYSNLGVIYLAQKNYAEAKIYFENALAINPNFAPSLHGLAAALANLGQIDLALEYYKKSIAADPYLLENYNHLASIYYRQKEINEAIEVFNAGLKALPESVELHTNFGILLANIGQYEAAAMEISKALKINSDYQPALQVLKQLTK